MCSSYLEDQLKRFVFIFLIWNWLSIKIAADISQKHLQADVLGAVPEAMDDSWSYQEL